jgi:predicted nucleic acid-binding protein
LVHQLLPALASAISHHRDDKDAPFPFLDFFLNTALHAIDLKNPKAQAISYSLLIKSLTVWKLDQVS